jgi:hypothetical protein
VSIVRVGLSETRHFAEGYEAIFGKKNKSRKTEATAKSSTAKRKKKAKKK